MNAASITTIMRRIERQAQEFDDSLATEDTTNGDPFRVLVSCLLSQRTKEETTTIAARRLFAVAATIDHLSELSEDHIATLIYPVGFWKTKARRIAALTATLRDRHGGTVPSTMEELLSLPGVGRKTANLVLSVAFNTPAICVDTHVHRIMNRLGFISTGSPEQSEYALRETLPVPLWKSVNYLLVLFGRNVCTPVSPKCSQCSVDDLCGKVAVGRHR